MIQSNPNIECVLPTLIKNPQLMDAFKIPDITSNITQLLQNPQLSSIVNVLSKNPDLLNQVTNIVSVNLA